VTTVLDLGVTILSPKIRLDTALTHNRTQLREIEIPFPENVYDAVSSWECSGKRNTREHVELEEEDKISKLKIEEIAGAMVRAVVLSSVGSVEEGGRKRL